MGARNLEMQRKKKQNKKMDSMENAEQVRSNGQGLTLPHAEAGTASAPSAGICPSARPHEQFAHPFGGQASFFGPSGTCLAWVVSSASSQLPRALSRTLKQPA